MKRKRAKQETFKLTNAKREYRCKMRKKTLALLVLLSVIALFIATPIIVSVAEGNPTKLEAFVKALDYALRGLIEYFKTVIELYKLTIST